MYVPSEILTNDDLATMVDTSDDWIRARTGIVERRIAAPKERTATMAIRAAWAALQVANTNPARLDLIIVATATPDYPFPATACLVQDALGAARAGAFDLSAGCTSFVYGLAVGSQMIISGAYDQVLVIGAETLSRIINWTDRNTCVLFGDGAGAVLLQASDVPGGVLSAVLGADGSGGDLLMLPAGGSRHPASTETVAQDMHYIHMNGPEVFRFATRVTAKAARQALAQANVNLEDVSLFILHQANGRIIQSAAKSLKLPPEKVFVNLDRYGNTSSASVPWGWSNLGCRRGQVGRAVARPTAPTLESCLATGSLSLGSHPLIPAPPGVENPVGGDEAVREGQWFWLKGSAFQPHLQGCIEPLGTSQSYTAGF
jgi:3-oxoacyl-[acyl-carrier-protein] synthase-3